jgi:hypothetical protein
VRGDLEAHPTAVWEEDFTSASSLCALRFVNDGDLKQIVRNKTLDEVSWWRGGRVQTNIFVDYLVVIGSASGR